MAAAAYVSFIEWRQSQYCVAIMSFWIWCWNLQALSWCLCLCCESLMRQSRVIASFLKVAEVSTSAALWTWLWNFNTFITFPILSNHKTFIHVHLLNWLSLAIRVSNNYHLYWTITYYKSVMVRISKGPDGQSYLVLRKEFPKPHIDNHGFDVDEEFTFKKFKPIFTVS